MDEISTLMAVAMIRNWKRAPSDRNQGQEIKNIERETNKDSKDTIITSKI